jgi:hypothetical protein
VREREREREREKSDAPRVKLELVPVKIEPISAEARRDISVAHLKLTREVHSARAAADTADELRAAAEVKAAVAEAALVKTERVAAEERAAMSQRGAEERRLVQMVAAAAREVETANIRLGSGPR